MFKDKYPSMSSPQMEAIVFIIFQIFFATCAEKWKILSDISQFWLGNILRSRDVFRPIAGERKYLMEFN